MITLKNPTFGSRGLLPDGYVQLHWIESTSTQYINTLIKPNQDTSVYAKIVGSNFTTSVSSRAVFGSRNTSTTGAMVMLGATDLIHTRYGSQNNADSSHSFSNGTSYEIAYEKNILTINGTVQKTFNAETFSGNYDFTFLAINTAGSIDCTISARLYYAQLYQDTTKVFDGIPCINPQNEVGMYDLVSQTFFGNSGTGVFIAGARVVDLPLGYTQVEYIQSSGTQYIDTGVSGKENYGIEIDFDATNSSGQFAPCGCVESYVGLGWYRLLFNNGSNWLFGYGNVSANLTAYTSKSRTVMRAIKNQLYINNTLASTLSPTSTPTIRNCYLFRENTPLSDANAMSGKVYYAKLYDNTTIIRDFIPCISSTNEVGMYDLVSEQFFGNAGSGTFTAGSPVLPLYLYNEGDECEVVTGGWGIHQEGSNTITKNDADISLVATSSGKYGFISTNNTINTSNYSYIVVRAKSTTANNTDLNIRYSTSSSNTGTYVGEIFNTSETGEKSIRFATSSFNGKYVVIRQGISSSGGTCSYNVYQVWLEP